MQSQQHSSSHLYLPGSEIFAGSEMYNPIGTLITGVNDATLMNTHEYMHNSSRPTVANQHKITSSQVSGQPHFIQTYEAQSDTAPRNETNYNIHQEVSSQYRSFQASSPQSSGTIVPTAGQGDFFMDLYPMGIDTNSLAQSSYHHSLSLVNKRKDTYFPSASRIRKDQS